MFLGTGEIAGLVTSVSWAGSCQIHTMAGRMIGAVNVTAARVPLYIAGIGMVAFFSGAAPGIPSGSLVFLLASALAGISLCDPLLYSASVIIGPRLAVLIQSLSACLTAVLGTLFLGESINLMGWVGILAASTGVAYVLTEGGVRPTGTASSGRFWAGVARASLSALAMAVSFLTLKQALRFDVDPLWAAFIRMIMGAALLWGALLVRGTLPGILRRVWTSWPVMRLLVFGCCVSTVGNCLASVAMKYTQAGIAATLIGLQPVMMIAINCLAERKYPSARAVAGTVMAFGGTAVIFLRDLF